MKWDVMHDRAKRVIDAFLENAGYWQEREDLSAGLTEEEKTQISEEVALMIASIRKRYKLQERLPEQEEQIQPEKVKAKIPAEEAKKTLPESVNEVKKEEKQEGKTVTANTEQEPEEKPKRGRKASGTEKKPAAKKGCRKKADQKENA